MRSAQGAIDWMRRQHESGATGWRGLCLRASRSAWGLPGGWPDANAWWAAVPAQHRHPWSSAPPLGAPVFFAGGRHGHIGLSDGAGGLWHTDAPNTDRIGHTSINWPRDRWGFRNVGWASWLNGAVLPVGGTTPPPNNGDDDDMPLTQADLDAIANTLRNDRAYLDRVARSVWTGAGGAPAGTPSYMNQVVDNIYNRLWGMPFIERVARFVWTGNGGQTGAVSFQRQMFENTAANADRVIADLGGDASPAVEIEAAEPYRDDTPPPADG